MEDFLLWSGYGSLISLVYGLWSCRLNDYGWLESLYFFSQAEAVRKFTIYFCHHRQRDPPRPGVRPSHWKTRLDGDLSKFRNPIGDLGWWIYMSLEGGGDIKLESMVKNTKISHLCCLKWPTCIHYFASLYQYNNLISQYFTTVLLDN